jgi:hypothetical protein
MKLRLERPLVRNPNCTIGELLVEGAFECFTLEDPEREIEGKPVAEWKIAHETAIQKGSYNVVITFSNRFNRDLPLLENVPGFEGIRIHPGNTASDTEGCILVGRGKTEKTVTESRAAFNALFPKIKQALDEGDTVTIEIT